MDFVVSVYKRRHVKAIHNMPCYIMSLSRNFGHKVDKTLCKTPGGNTPRDLIILLTNSFIASDMIISTRATHGIYMDECI